MAQHCREKPGARVGLVARTADDVACQALDIGSEFSAARGKQQQI